MMALAIAVGILLAANVYVCAGALIYHVAVEYWDMDEDFAAPILGCIWPVVVAVAPALWARRIVLRRQQAQLPKATSKERT